MPSPVKAADPSPSAHRNDVLLIGELAAPPQVRTLPSGDEVLAFRLTVRSAPDRVRSATKLAAAGSPTHQTDSLECAAWRPVLQTRLQRCGVGDVLEISGALRHRFWRGPGGLASRYEIEADKIRVVTRAPTRKPEPEPGSG